MVLTWRLNYICTSPWLEHISLWLNWYLLLQIMTEIILLTQKSFLDICLLIYAADSVIESWSYEALKQALRPNIKNVNSSEFKMSTIWASAICPQNLSCLCTCQNCILIVPASITSPDNAFNKPPSTMWKHASPVILKWMLLFLLMNIC